MAECSHPTDIRFALRAVLIDGLKFLGLVALLSWLLYRGSTDLGYNWQWYQVPKYLGRMTAEGFQPGPLLLGLGVTLKVTGASFGLTFLIGLVTALLRLSGSPVASLVARVYMEAIRNTPLLVQLFFIYFVFAPIVGLGAFASAVLALSLFEGAYASEIFRAGIVSIERGQWEAAMSLGMTRAQCYRHVILPQAVRRILPPLTSQAVSLVKDSALVSTIAIYDLTMRGQAIIAETFLTFEIWFTVAAMYLVLTLALSALSHGLERRLRPA